MFNNAASSDWLNSTKGKTQIKQRTHVSVYIYIQSTNYNNQLNWSPTFFAATKFKKIKRQWWLMAIEQKLDISPYNYYQWRNEEAGGKSQKFPGPVA
jgi:hypothetical protein